MHHDDWVVVYRGFAVPALDLVQAMLDAEGFEPRRLGRANPALLGVGNAAVEQLIEVRREHENAAVALITASLQASPDAAQSEKLEQQALSAPIEPSSRSVADRGGFSPQIIALIVAAFILLFLWLR
jgi:PleD family two-component response regulator